MAKKVLLQDQHNNEILPITRGELILDSSGKMAFHSNEFLATDSQPGLMSPDDKQKLETVAGNTVDTELSDTSTNPVQNKVLTQIINSIREKYLKSAVVSGNKVTITDQSDNTIEFVNSTHQIVTNAVDGLVPKYDAVDGTIDAQTTDWVLTNHNGTLGWYNLPATAFSSSSVQLFVGEESTSNNNNSNSATTNGNTYLKLFDNSTLKNQYNIKGTGLTTVISDDNGTIIINTPTSHNQASSDINSLTGYTKAADIADIDTSDSLNTALGKLELKADTTYELVQGAYNGDGTIENLVEILKVLEGISDTDTIKELLGKYLLLTGGTIHGHLSVGDETTTSQYLLSVQRNSQKLSLSISGANEGWIKTTYESGNSTALIQNETTGLLYKDVDDNYYTLLHSGNIGDYKVGSANYLLPSATTIPINYTDTEARVKYWFDWGNSTEESLSTYTYGLHFVSADIRYSHILGFNTDDDRLYIRGCRNNEWGGWKEIAYISDIPTVTNYYWANVKVSSSSNPNTTPSFLTTDAQYYNFKGSSGSSFGYIGRGGSADVITFGTYGEQYINIMTNGTTRMHVSSLGDIGIGTTSPSYKLDVEGSIAGNVIYANRAGSYNSGGVSLYYNADPSNYGIMFRGTSSYGTHGGVTSDWATYFTMSDTTNRGWIFRRGSTNVASIAGTGAGSFTAAGADKYIAYPQGGQYTWSSGNITGAIKIKLPVFKSATMMSMVVTIYNYSTGTSTTYTVGGYNYYDGNWYNEFAYANRQELSAYGNLPVRFGNDGSNDCIYIGETTTTWSYPNIVVSNVLLGFSNYYFSSWATGWEISIVSSLGTISKIVTNPAINYCSNYSELLLPEGSTTAAATSWHPKSSYTKAWGQAFKNTSISSDTGDILYYLRPGEYGSGASELCVAIDGDYYAGVGQYKVMHEGNYSSYLGNYVTINTDQTITGSKTFESASNYAGVSLKLKNKNWYGGMSTAMDFYNGGGYAVPNARIETKMVGDGRSGGTLIFYTQTAHASINPNPNGLVERMRIDDAGNVGIGATSPKYKLDVTENARVNQIVFEYNDEINRYGGNLYLQYRGTIAGSQGDSRTGNIFMCATGGLVGIGTTSPTQKLSVNGAIYTMQPSSNRQAGIIGTYDPDRAAAIWSMGSAYQIAADGLSLGSLYGAAYVYYGPGYTFGVGKSGGHSFVWAQNGTPKAALGDNIWTSGVLETESYLTFGSSGASFTSDIRNTWRQSLYGNTANGSRFRTVRTNVTIADFSEIYGSGITWATDDTQGYLSVSHSGGKAFIGGGASNYLNWSYQLLHSGNYSSIIDSYYIKSQGMMNSAYACIPTYNGENGWHRIATICGNVGHGSYILYLCGSWSYASNTNAIIHIDTMHTTAQLTQVSGIVGYVTNIRLVNIGGNEYYVDVYINYSGSNTPGSVYCYFLGNGTITPRTTAEKITAPVTASAELGLVNGGRANSAGVATIARSLGSDETMKLYSNYSNEINFGGTNNSSTIFFGYRATDSKPIPTSFVFGGSTGTASITASTLIATCSDYGTVKIYGTSGQSRMIEDTGTTNGFYIKTVASWGMTLKANNNEVVIGNNTKAMYTNQGLDLGTSAKPWGNIYGTLKGDADTVDGYHIWVGSSLPATKTNNTIYIVI